MKIYADNIDITSFTGAVSWQNTIAELATTLTFDIAKTDMQYINVYLPKVGSIIRLVMADEIFRGIVLTIDDGGKTSNKYTAVDFAFYLNKNQEVYQFTESAANDAIRQICSDFGIPIDSLCDVPFVFSKIYLDKSAAEVIWDILEMAGGNFNFDVTPHGLRVYQLGTFHAAPTFRLSTNTQWLDSAAYRGNVSHSVSIEDLKNSVKVVSGDEKGFQVLQTDQNADLISKYGLLQTVEKVDEKNIGEAANIAAAKLAELSREKETFSFEIIEDADGYTRAGYEIEVDGGVYIIEGSAHSIKNGVHYVKLDLRKF
jgi:hypothetical protein